MRIGLVSDVHWMADPPASSAGWHGTGAEFRGTLHRLAHAFAICGQERVDVIVIAGDLAHRGEADSLLAVLRACAGVSAPVLVVSGNHDVAGDPGRLERACCRARIDNVSLASLTGDEFAGIRVAGVQVGETDGWFGARLSTLPATQEWGSGLVALASHFPALSLAADVSARGFPYPGDLIDREALAERLLAREAPTVVIGGHVHARATRTERQVLQLTNGAIVEPPYECAVIEVEQQPDGSATVRRSCTRLLTAPGDREPVLAPEREHWRYSPDDRRWSPVPPQLATPPAIDGDENRGRQIVSARPDGSGRARSGPLSGNWQPSQAVPPGIPRKRAQDETQHRQDSHHAHR